MTERGIKRFKSRAEKISKQENISQSEAKALLEQQHLKELDQKIKEAKAREEKERQETIKQKEKEIEQAEKERLLSLIEKSRTENVKFASELEFRRALRLAEEEGIVKPSFVKGQRTTFATPLEDVLSKEIESGVSRKKIVSQISEGIKSDTLFRPRIKEPEPTEKQKQKLFEEQVNKKLTELEVRKKSPVFTIEAKRDIEKQQIELNKLLQSKRPVNELTKAELAQMGLAQPFKMPTSKLSPEESLRLTFETGIRRSRQEEFENERNRSKIGGGLFGKTALVGDVIGAVNNLPKITKEETVKLSKGLAEETIQLTKSVKETPSKLVESYRELGGKEFLKEVGVGFGDFGKQFYVAGKTGVSSSTVTPIYLAPDILKKYLPPITEEDIQKVRFQTPETRRAALTVVSTGGFLLLPKPVQTFGAYTMATLSGLKLAKTPTPENLGEFVFFAGLPFLSKRVEAFKKNRLVPEEGSIVVKGTKTFETGEGIKTAVRKGEYLSKSGKYIFFDERVSLNKKGQGDFIIRLRNKKGSLISETKGKLVTKFESTPKKGEFGIDRETLLEFKSETVIKPDTGKKIIEKQKGEIRIGKLQETDKGIQAEVLTEFGRATKQGSNIRVTDEKVIALTRENSKNVFETNVRSGQIVIRDVNLIRQKAKQVALSPLLISNIGVAEGFGFSGDFAGRGNQFVISRPKGEIKPFEFEFGKLRSLLRNDFRLVEAVRPKFGGFKSLFSGIPSSLSEFKNVSLVSDLAETDISSISENLNLSEFGAREKAEESSISRTQALSDVTSLISSKSMTSSKPLTEALTEGLSRSKSNTLVESLVNTASDTFSGVTVGVGVTNRSKPRPSITPSISITDRPIKEIITPFVLPSFPVSQKGLYGKGYDAQVKEKGRWITVNKKDEPLSESSAKSEAARIVDKSLSARFRIKESKSKNPPKQNFDNYFNMNKFKFQDYDVRGKTKRKLNNEYIEKRKYRLDDPTEVNKIQASRLIAKQRKNRMRLF